MSLSAPGISDIPADYNLLLAVINGNETQSAKLKELRDAQSAAVNALTELNLGKAAAQALVDAKAEREEAQNLLADIQTKRDGMLSDAQAKADAIVVAADERLAQAIKDAQAYIDKGKAEGDRLMAEGQARIDAAQQAIAEAEETKKTAEAAISESTAKASEAETAKLNHDEGARQLGAKIEKLKAAIAEVME